MGVFYCWVPLVVGLPLLLVLEGIFGVSPWMDWIPVVVFLGNLVYGVSCALLCHRA
jgi:hypothetical protein